MQVVKAINPTDFSTEYILVNKDYDIVIPVRKYLNYLKATGKSPNTLRNYCFHLKAFFSFLEEVSLEHNQVDTDTLVSFIQWLRKPIRSMQVDFIYPEDTVCDQTVNTIVTAISSFYQYICRMEEFRNPVIYAAVPIPANGYKGFLIHARRKMVSKNLLKRYTVKRLVTVIPEDQFKVFFSSIKNLRDKLIILLMYEGGLRIGEVLSLWIDDLFLWDKRIRILPKHDLLNGARVKSRVERFVDISSQLAEHLDNYLLFNRPDCFDTSHLFVVEKGPNTGKPLAYNTVYKMFKYYSQISGISLNPHVLRHSHATALIRAGWDASFVQRRLGHAQVQTTINTYVHLSDEDLKQSYQKYEQWKEGFNESN